MTKMHKKITEGNCVKITLFFSHISVFFEGGWLGAWPPIAPWLPRCADADNTLY